MESNARRVVNDVIIVLESVSLIEILEISSIFLDVYFFNVVTYPEILFTSHAVANLPCNDTLDYISTGKLQMLGVNKHLDIQFNLVGTGENDAGKEIAIFKGGFTFNRTQFGMPEYEGIADNVFVEFTTELTKQ